MRKHSAGAILYTIYNNEVYIVLGMEKGDYFPFKGVREKNETNQMAAIREIHEETCGVVCVDSIDLQCHFSTKRKHYHIGLTYISLDEIEQFRINKKMMESETNPNRAFLEKTHIKIFRLSQLHRYHFHEVTYKPIKFYKNQLESIQRSLPNSQSSNIERSELPRSGRVRHIST